MKEETIFDILKLEDLYKSKETLIYSKELLDEEFELADFLDKENRVLTNTDYTLIYSEFNNVIWQSEEDFRIVHVINATFWRRLVTVNEIKEFKDQIKGCDISIVYSKDEHNIYIVSCKIPKNFIPLKNISWNQLNWLAKRWERYVKARLL